MLYDYRAGHDFASMIGIEPIIPIFETIDAHNANDWRRLLDPAQWAGLPFERWSQAHGGPHWRGYDCQPKALLGG
jgi:hypothetical protein